MAHEIYPKMKVENRKSKDERRKTKEERRKKKDERRKKKDERRKTKDERRKTKDERRTSLEEACLRCFYFSNSIVVATEETFLLDLRRETVTPGPYCRRNRNKAQ